MDIVQDPEGAAPSDGPSLSRGPLECSSMDIVPDPEGMDTVQDPEGAGPLDGSSLVRGPLECSSMDIVQDPEGAAPSDGSSLSRGPMECSSMDIMQDPAGAGPSDGSSLSRGPLKCSSMDIVQDSEGAGPLDGSLLSKGPLECSCDAAVPTSPQPPLWLSRRHTHAAAMPLEKPSTKGAAPAPAHAPVGALSHAPPQGANPPSGGNQVPAEPTSGAGSRAGGRPPPQRKAKATPGPRTTHGEMHQRPCEVLFASYNANGLKEGQCDLLCNELERLGVAACAIQETKLRDVNVSWDQSKYVLWADPCYEGPGQGAAGGIAWAIHMRSGPFAKTVGDVRLDWPRGVYSHPPTGLSVCPPAPSNGEV